MAKETPKDGSPVGVSRGLTLKQIRKWVDEQFTEKARYDAHLSQDGNTGEYHIRIYWVKDADGNVVGPPPE